MLVQHLQSPIFSKLILVRSRGTIQLHAPAVHPNANLSRCCPISSTLATYCDTNTSPRALLLVVSSVSIALCSVWMVTHSGAYMYFDTSRISTRSDCAS